MSRVYFDLQLKGAFSTSSENGLVFGSIRDLYGEQLSTEALSILREVWNPMAIAIRGGSQQEVDGAIERAKVLLESRLSSARGLVSSGRDTAIANVNDDETLFDDEVDFDE